MITDYFEEMERHADNPEVYVEADIRFHESLAKATHNSILELLLNFIRDALGENIRTLAERRSSIIEEALKHHRRIAQAVAQHNPDKARLAMREHLEAVTRALQ